MGSSSSPLDTLYIQIADSKSYIVQVLFAVNQSRCHGHWPIVKSSAVDAADHSHWQPEAFRISVHDSVAPVCLSVQITVEQTNCCNVRLFSLTQ